MGSAVTSFTSIIEARSLGTADINAMVAAIDKQSASLENLGKKASEVNEHPGFDAFASKIKAGIQDPLAGIGSAAESALGALGPLGVGVAATGGIFVAAGLGIFEAAKSLGAWGIGVRDIELRTGLSAKQVGEFSFAAKAAGQDVSIFERMMRGLTMAVEDNSAKGAAARQWLGAFHVDMAAVKDGTADTATVLAQIADGLEKLPTVWERNKAALDIFKRGGIEAIPVLMELSENLKTARADGFGFSDAEVQQNLKYQKSVSEIETAWDRVWRSIKEGSVGAAVALKDLATNGHPGVPQVVRGPGGLPMEAGFKMPDPAAEDASRAQMRADAALDAGMAGHVKRLNEALAAYREEEAKLKTFESEMYAKAMGPVESIFTKRDAFTGAQRGPATDAALVGASAAIAKENAASAKEDFEMARKSGEEASKNWDATYKTFNKTSAETVKNFMKAAEEAKRTRDEVDRIQVGAERSEIVSRSNRAGGMAQLAYGPGQEGQAAVAAYQERIRLANELYGFEMSHAKGYGDTVRAEADLDKEAYEAKTEQLQKIAELQRKNIDELRGMAGGLFESFFQGPKGIEQFAMNFLKGQGSIVFQDAIQQLLPKGLPFGGSSSPWLRGTILGQDPAKVATDATDATDANTAATTDNTTALRAFAMSSTGGGGGLYSPSAGTFARMAGIGPTGSGETATESWGLPTEGMYSGGDSGEASGEAPNDFILTQPFPSGRASMSFASKVGLGATVGMGAFSAYSGFKAGGTQGALQGVGGALAAGGALLKLLDPALKTIPVVGEIIGMALPLVSMLMGDPKANRSTQLQNEALAAAYRPPTVTDYTSDIYGNSVGYNYMGQSRPVQVTVQQTVQAMDAPSLTQFLKRNPDALSVGITSAINGGNAEDLVATMRARVGASS
jgi:hypothetical protein